jgi:hypothetical protein
MQRRRRLCTLGTTHGKLMMENSSLSFVGSIATVALTAIAIRWVLGAKGAKLPKIQDGTSVYGIKWQWRGFGASGAAFSLVLLIWSWHDLHRPDGVLTVASLIFITIGIWLASGSVRTDRIGITKRALWRSRSLRWDEVTEVRLHKKQGGAIEVRAGSRKLIIDSRFVAFQHLLNEIEAHTKLGESG